MRISHLQIQRMGRGWEGEREAGGEGERERGNGERAVGEKGRKEAAEEGKTEREMLEMLKLEEVGMGR